MWFLILPILAPILTYGLGSILAIFLATFFLKTIIEIAFIFVGLLMFINYAKHSHEYKNGNGKLVLLLAVGFLLSPLILNSYGHFFGINSIAPILSYSAVSGTGDMTIGSVTMTNFDIGFALVFIAALYFTLTKSGQKMLKDLRKKL